MGVFDPIILCCWAGVLVQTDVSLGVGGGGVSGVGYSIQEVGCCNCSPCLRNRFFLKLVHSPLGILGMTDRVHADLEKLGTRDAWILEISIDRQGGT